MKDDRSSSPLTLDFFPYAPILSLLRTVIRLVKIGVKYATPLALTRESDMNDWVAELETINVGDQRLNERARQVLAELGAQPEASIPAACGGWPETKAASRLFDHERVSQGFWSRRRPVANSGCTSTRGCCVSRIPRSSMIPAKATLRGWGR